MRIQFIIFLMSLTLLGADQQYDRGEQLYFEKGCNGCHGTKAEGMNTYPALANRAKGFMEYKLRRFRDEISDKQIQEMMIPFAKELSDQQIDDLVYFLYHYHDTQTERYDIDFEQEGDGGS